MIQKKIIFFFSFNIVNNPNEGGSQSGALDLYQARLDAVPGWRSYQAGQVANAGSKSLHAAATEPGLLTQNLKLSTTAAAPTRTPCAPKTRRAAAPVLPPPPPDGLNATGMINGIFLAPLVRPFSFEIRGLEKRLRRLLLRRLN